MVKPYSLKMPINKLFSLHYPLALDELDLDVIDNPKADFSELKKGEGFYDHHRSSMLSGNRSEGL